MLERSTRPGMANQLASQNVRKWLNTTKRIDVGGASEDVELRRSADAAKGLGLHSAFIDHRYIAWRWQAVEHWLVADLSRRAGAVMAALPGRVFGGNRIKKLAWRASATRRCISPFFLTQKKPTSAPSVSLAAKSPEELRRRRTSQRILLCLRCGPHYGCGISERQRASSSCLTHKAKVAGCPRIMASSVGKSSLAPNGAGCDLKIFKPSGSYPAKCCGS